MISPSKRTEDITYAVRDVVLVAREAGRAGQDLIYLNIGDPLQFDFKTPKHIIEAAIQALKQQKNGYAASEGTAEALAAISEKAKSDGIANIQDIFVANGVSEAIDIAFAALLNPGDNVLIPFPSYPLYGATLAKYGAKAKPYFLDELSGWQPDVAQLRKAIDAGTRAIVLINPNNPTGAVCECPIIEEIIELADEHNLLLFSDEIYSELILDEKPHLSPAALNHDLPVVTLNGISKSYLAPGWRLGWAIVSGAAPKVSAYVEALGKLTRARLCANHPLQSAIAPALRGPQDHLIEAKEKLRRRRDLSMQKLNAIPGISCVKPEGAFYAFPKIHIAGMNNDKKFVEDLIRQTGVVTVHGSGFGQKPDSQHFRIVFLPDEKTLATAYARIDHFVRSQFFKVALVTPQHLRKPNKIATKIT
jgi:alanine-synthesizing transaminase